MSRGAHLKKFIKTSYKYFVCVLVGTVLISHLTILIIASPSEENNSIIECSIYFEEPSIRKINLGGSKFTTIDVKDCISSAESGEPVLPFYPASVLIPPDSNIKDIKITNYNFKKLSFDFKNSPIIPQQEILPYSSEKNSKEFVINKTKYNLDKPVFENIFSNEGIGFCRGYKILNLNIYPVKYIPKKGLLYYTDRVNIKITLEKNNNENFENNFLRNNKNDQNFIKTIVENPYSIDTYNEETVMTMENNENTFDYTDGICNSDQNFEYVIITKNSLSDTNGYRYELSDLVSHRENYSNLNATIVTVEEIDSCNSYWNETAVFNDTQAHIREFCKDAYLNWNTQYILLAGDWDSIESHKIVPYRLFTDRDETQDYNTMASDMYYSHLDGDWYYDSNNIWGGGKNGANDLYGELYIGRITCNSPETVSNAVYKIINYDTNNSYRNSWLRSVGFFGGDLGSQWDVTSKDYLEELRLGTDTYRTFTGFEEWNENKTDDFDTTERIYHKDIGSSYLNDFDSSIENDESSIINHLGHTSVNSPFELINWESRYNSKPFFGFSQGCISGRFHDGESGCEKLICSNEKRHAYALVLNTGYGYGSGSSTNGPSHYINCYFFDYFLRDQSENKENWQLGKAMLYAKDKIASVINSRSHAWCYAWYSANFFGDPAQTLKIDNQNNPPEIQNENPLDGSVDVSIDLSNLSIYISDSNSDSLSWTIETSPNIGNSLNENDIDGIKKCNISNLNYNTLYNWYVNCTDGIIWTNNSYSFTTREKYIPSSPLNFTATALDENQIRLNWDTPDLADFIIVEYNQITNSWNKSEGVEIYNGSGELTNHNNLSENTTYFYQAWSKNNTDNVFSTNPSRISCTTLTNNPPFLTNEVPENNSLNIDIYYDNISVLIEDENNENFNYSIQGKYVLDNIETNSSNGIKSVELITPLPYNESICWYVNTTNSNKWNNKTFVFKTRNKYIPSKPSFFNASIHNETAINLSWSNIVNNNTIIEYGFGNSWNRSEGIEIYNGTDSTFQHTKLKPITKYYYQIWSYNNTDKTYSNNFISCNATTYSNNISFSIIDEYPVNNSQGISIDLSSLTVSVNISNGETFNWYIETKPSIGNNFKLNSTNESLTCAISDLSYSTVYTWYVNVTNGEIEENKIFTFRTQSRPQNNNNNNPPSTGGYTPPVVTDTNNNPVADAGGPYEGIVNKSIFFDGKNSYDIDEDKLSYEWFINNKSFSEINCSIIFTKVSNYSVELIVTDELGLSDKDLTYVKIKENTSVETEKSNTTDNSTQNSSGFDLGGIPDSIETQIGSDANNSNKIFELLIGGNTFYLIDTNNDNYPDLFYDKTNNIKTEINKSKNGIFLIDTDGDNNWDYTYNIYTNNLAEYSEISKEKLTPVFSFELLIIFVFIVMFMIGIIAFYKFRKPFLEDNKFIDVISKKIHGNDLSNIYKKHFSNSSNMSDINSNYFAEDFENNLKTTKFSSEKSYRKKAIENLGELYKEDTDGISDEIYKSEPDFTDQYREIDEFLNSIENDIGNRNEDSVDINKIVDDVLESKSNKFES